MGQDTKKHHTAQTSLLALREFLKTDKPPKETVAVFEALAKKQPLTRRALNELTGIPITNLCRVLFNATNTGDPLIKVCYVNRCPVTKTKVRYYSLIDYVPSADEMEIK